MIRSHTLLSMLSVMIALPCAVGCDDFKAAPLAPTASSLAPAKPKTADAKTFAIDKGIEQNRVRDGRRSTRKFTVA